GCICCNQSDKWMMPESHDNHRSKRRQYDRTCISRHVSDDADEDDRRNDESGRRNLDDASHGHFEITRFLSKSNTDHDNEHHAERGKFVMAPVSICTRPSPLSRLTDSIVSPVAGFSASRWNRLAISDPRSIVNMSMMNKTMGSGSLLPRASTTFKKRLKSPFLSLVSMCTFLFVAIF